MAAIHGVLAIVTAVGLGAMLVTAAATWAGRLSTRLWLDRAILLEAGAAGIAAFTGLALAVTAGRFPVDPLHVLYGALVAAAPLAGRYAARDQPTPRLGRAMTLLGMLVVGILIRAFMTGG